MSERKQVAIFFTTIVISLLVGWHVLAAVFALAWSNEAYTHILLVLPISLSLAYLDWPKASTNAVLNWRAGSVLLITALVAAGLAKWTTSANSDVQLSIYIFAVVLSWLGMFVACFGNQLSRKLIFPLCFLFWLIPIPAVFLDDIISFLQTGSAYTARLLFSGIGVPVAQDGIVLTIPGLTVEVAQECSSIRSSMMLLVTTMVLAQLFLRSPWRKALVIALVVPLSLAKNGLRIFTIAMLGTHLDPSYLTGRFHHQGGVIFLTIALAAEFLLLWFLRDDKSGRTLSAPHATIATAPK